MLPITQAILTSSRNRPALRNRSWYTIRKLKGIVIHWTANTSVGANAIRNRNYFNTTPVYASAHYIVDDHSIVQCIPDEEVAYHVGGRYYRPMGEEIREDGLTPNYFLIGIEMCVNADGDWNKTYQHSVELTRFLLNKFNFTVKDVYRHYDITGKDCPKMMLEESAWQKFRNDVNRGLDFQLENPIKQAYINASDLNVRRGNGIQYDIVGKLQQGDEIQVFEEAGNWFRIGDERWVHKHYVVVTFIKKEGIVDDPTGLNVRSGPGVQHEVVEVLEDGTPVEIYDQEDNWLRIGNNKWAYYKLIKIVEIKTGRVVFANFLNVRSGPGTNNQRVKTIEKGSLVKIFETEGLWYRIGDDEWVYGAYIEILE